MNENYGYQNNGYTEPDYYTMYTNEKVKEAKGVFSRYFLALFLYLLISNAVVFAAQILMILFMGTEGATEFLNNNIYIQWLLGVGPMYLVGFPVFYLIIRKMKTIKTEKKKITFGEFIIFFLISEGAMYFGSIVGNMLNSFIGAILGQEVNNSTAELIEKSPMWLIIFIVVVIGPIIEEFLFRKFMIDRLGRYGDILAISASAIAFGFFHGNFYQFFYAAMIGFVLGYIYTTTRDVKYTIILHMLINFLGSIVPMFIQGTLDDFMVMIKNFGSGAEIDMQAFYKGLMLIGSYSIIQYAMMGAGIVLLITAFTRRKIKFSGTCEYLIPKYRIADATLVNVGTILFLIFSLVQFAASIFIA